MVKANKEFRTDEILKLASGHIRKCRKLPLDNIVFPKWNDLGLLGMIFRQEIRTKEQPEGCLYDEAVYRVVMRVISGRVLMTGGQPDAYTWKHSKLEKCKDIRMIGCNSAEALLNLNEVLQSITDHEEQLLFADMFCNMKKDLLLVKTPEESRKCIEITLELYKAGITYCVDEWMKPDENGECITTQLNIGDFLNVTPKGVYCIRREEFLQTHTLD